MRLLLDIIFQHVKIYSKNQKNVKITCLEYLKYTFGMQNLFILHTNWKRNQYRLFFIFSINFWSIVCKFNEKKCLWNHALFCIFFRCSKTLTQIFFKWKKNNKQQQKQHPKNASSKPWDNNFDIVCVTVVVTICWFMDILYYMHKNINIKQCNQKRPINNILIRIWKQHDFIYFCLIMLHNNDYVSFLNSLHFDKIWF